MNRGCPVRCEHLGWQARTERLSTSRDGFQGEVGSPLASSSATAAQASVCPEYHEASASSTPLSAVVLSHDF